MAYENPARVVRICRDKGHRTVGEIYECAIGRMPRDAPQAWAREARRLATEQGTLDGGRRPRRRRKKSRRAHGRGPRKRR